MQKLINIDKFANFVYNFSMLIKNTKKNYYVFLDIDGTLWSYDNITELLLDEETEKLIKLDKDDPLSVIEKVKLSDESMYALNTLLVSLKNSFRVKLVITSRRRTNFPKCINFLKINGLQYDDPIFCTPLNNALRGKKIVDYLNLANEAPVNFNKKNFMGSMLYEFISRGDFKNFVVLDDDFNSLKDYIPPSRLILTNAREQSLTLDQVKKYLKTNKIKLVEPNESERNFN